MNRRDSGNRLFGEDAQLQGERSRELAIQIHGTAAHAGDNARVLHFRPFQLHEDDGLLRTEKIVQHTDDFLVELLDLVPGENGVGIPLHAGPNLVQRKRFLWLLSFDGTRNQAKRSEEREESEEKSSATIRRMRPGRKHEP